MAIEKRRSPHRGTQTLPPEIEARLRLLDVPQICDLLRVSKEWLYDVCQAGQFPHLKVGRQLRFRAIEIEAYLNGEWKAGPPEKETPPVTRIRRRAS